MRVQSAVTYRTCLRPLPLQLRSCCIEFREARWAVKSIFGSFRGSWEVPEEIVEEGFLCEVFSHVRTKMELLPVHQKVFSTLKELISSLYVKENFWFGVDRKNYAAVRSSLTDISGSGCSYISIACYTLFIYSVHFKAIWKQIACFWHHSTRRREW